MRAARVVSGEAKQIRIKRQKKQGVATATARTRAPLGVDLDDLVNEGDIGVAAALRFADEVRVATLVGAEEHDVEHGRARLVQNIGVLVAAAAWTTTPAGTTCMLRLLVEASK